MTKAAVIALLLARTSPELPVFEGMNETNANVVDPDCLVRAGGGELPPAVEVLSLHAYLDDDGQPLTGCLG